MFSGIISHLGKLRSYKKNIFTFEVPSPFAKSLKEGDSVAVNGVCLTIIENGPNFFQIEVMPETLKKTSLVFFKIGDFVNLELPLGTTERFAGHMVQGHIDGMATIKNIKKQGNSRIFTFKIPASLSRLIVEKGSIAVNGISLTVIKTSDDSFTVGIIPYTWNHTMLKMAKVGDKVNVEVDIFAKYLRKFVKGYLKR